MPHKNFSEMVKRIYFYKIVISTLNVRRISSKIDSYKKTGSLLVKIGKQQAHCNNLKEAS